MIYPSLRKGINVASPLPRYIALLIWPGFRLGNAAENVFMRLFFMLPTFIRLPRNSKCAPSVILIWHSGSHLAAARAAEMSNVAHLKRETGHLHNHHYFMIGKNLL